VAEFAPRGAFAGAGLPLVAGAARLSALPEAAVVSLAPFRGRAAAVEAALGAALPDPGGTAALADGSRLIWAGIDLWLLRGPAAEAAAARLEGDAAVTDQTDGWAGLAIEGAAAAEVLARLVPLDLAAMAPGRAAASGLKHVACLILAREGGFEALVPRSFAGTAVHEIGAAMRSVAARARLVGGRDG